MTIGIHTRPAVVGPSSERLARMFRVADWAQQIASMNGGIEA